jgi:hypothetical protein
MLTPMPSWAAIALPIVLALAFEARGATVISALRVGRLGWQAGDR